MKTRSRHEADNVFVTELSCYVLPTYLRTHLLRTSDVHLAYPFPTCLLRTSYVPSMYLVRTSVGTRVPPTYLVCVPFT